MFDVDDWERAGLRSANYGMRNQLDSMLDILSEQQQRMTEIRADLAEARFGASSADGAVELTVDSTGMLLDLQFASAAQGRSLDQLRLRVLEAYAAAVHDAREQADALIGPLAEAAGISPDLPDLLPGASPLRDRADAETGL
ncbi:YbaB/EbfC family nucleoid-associated protein [Nocardia sp. NPDC019395]|uniref:YbaB/EbfC family nucleoid-associated protein n=1 Tax=Nocardia sp. NPDC019395 TaxID=3154686 RepID=UPI0033EE10C1